MIKYLIFDWGNVCTFGHLLKDFCFNLSGQCGLDKAEIEKAFRDLDYPYETGLISPENFWSDFRNKLSIEISIESIQDIFLNSYKINRQMLDYILELRKQYKTVLFSNNYEDMFTHIVATYKLSDYFDELFSSSGIKFKKPEREAYEYVLDKLEIKPEEAILIDDKEKNLAGARAVGIKTILFKDVNEFKKQLVIA